jgi:hypothetical protein
MKNQLAKRILYGIWENLFGFVVKCLVITVPAVHSTGCIQPAGPDRVEEQLPLPQEL